MSDSDSVRDYCQQRGCPEQVVRRGLDGLVEAWESAVAYMLANKPQYLDDYLNDMDGRQILDECLAVATPGQREAVAARVEAADEAFRQGTVLVGQCLWGPDNAQRNGWTAATNWWYFRTPKKYRFQW
jgi:hypothetical protein